VQCDPLRPLEADETDLYVDGQDQLDTADDVKVRLANSIARSSVPVETFTGRYDVQLTGDSIANLQGTAGLTLSRSEFDGLRIYPSMARLRFGDGRMRLDSVRIETTGELPNPWTSDKQPYFWLKLVPNGWWVVLLLPLGKGKGALKTWYVSWQPKDERWRQFVEGLDLPAASRLALTNAATFDMALDRGPEGTAPMFYAATRTTFSPNMCRAGTRSASAAITSARRVQPRPRSLHLH